MALVEVQLFPSELRVRFTRCDLTGVDPVADLPDSIFGHMLSDEPIQHLRRNRRNAVEGSQDHMLDSDHWRSESLVGEETKIKRRVYFEVLEMKPRKGAGSAGDPGGECRGHE